MKRFEWRNENKWLAAGLDELDLFEENIQRLPENKWYFIDDNHWFIYYGIYEDGKYPKITHAERYDSWIPFDVSLFQNKIKQLKEKQNVYS